MFILPPGLPGSVPSGATPLDPSFIDFPASPVAVPASYEQFASAIRDGDLAQLRALISHPMADVTVQDAEQVSLLHTAVGANCCEAIRLLLRANSEYAFLNALSPDGTALSIAAQSGLDAVVELLLSLGAQVDIPREADGDTALMGAAARGSRSIVQQLIANGANVNAQNEAGDTALMMAARRQAFPVVSLLLRSGAAVNIANYRGVTPLMAAAAAGDIYTVKALLAFGANVRGADHAGRTAMTVSGHDAVTQVLASALAPTGEFAR
jgi:ankyrin repeat protein